MRTKHSPGTWVAEVNHIVARDKDGNLTRPNSIAVIPDTKRPISPESEANARLIAAAPDLLAALKSVVAIADRNTVEFNAAKLAIAKAEGNQ